MARRKRRSSAVVLLNGLLSIVVLGLLAAGALFVYGLHVFYEDGPNDTAAAFLVEKGSNLNTMQARLAEQGFIPAGLVEPLVFNAATRLLGARETKLLPGQYMVPAHASMSDILTIITETKPVEFFVNVIPGETSWQVAAHINDPAQSLSGESIAPPPEGSLLAVRHDFFPGDSRQGVIDAMEKKMATELARIWGSRDPAIDEVIKSPEELVTLASLVEKETGLAGERPQVAAVFINRLKRHMRLQTDPSVMYGITLGKGKLERKLTTADLKTKTAYNTYQIDGLPAGPIANPGVDALEAVAHPDDSKYLYFVAKTDDPADGHYFASSYAEHRKNVAKYRKAVKDAAKEDEADAAREALEAEQAQDSGDQDSGDQDSGDQDSGDSAQ